MTEYDSRVETNKHIGRVRHFMARARDNLAIRAAVHDASKLVSPEVEAFNIATPKLETLEYGSPEYKQSLKDMGPALEHHYEHNDHHPEHFPGLGVRGMSAMGMIEMVCDWRAASERTRKPTPAAPGHPEVPAYDSNFARSLLLNQERWGYGDELSQIIVNTAIELGLVEEGTRVIQGQFVRASGKQSDFHIETPAGRV